MGSPETYSNHAAIDFADPPYDGPTDQQIEDEEIERDIERWEEDLRGENGPEAQAKAQAQSSANLREMAAQRHRWEQGRKLMAIFGSPALAKAVEDEFDYALKLKSGEVIRFTLATLNPHGWITLHGVTRDDMTTGHSLPYPAGRGVDVRLDEILWVMDAPCGS